MAETELTAAQWLEKAWKAYQFCDRTYRDALLEIGNCLQTFVRLRVQEADGMSRVQREKVGVSREVATKEAATRMQMRVPRINMLISASMTVNLLSDNGQIGSLGHNSIVRFSQLIHRKVGAGQMRPGRHGIPFSQASEWEVKQKYDGQAQRMFRQAVEEGWGWPRVVKEVAAVIRRDTGRTAAQTNHDKDEPLRYRSGSRGRSCKENELPSSAEELKLLSKVAGPRDMAEVLAEIVLESSDPKALLEHLSRAVARKQKEQSPYFAEVG